MNKWLILAAGLAMAGAANAGEGWHGKNPHAFGGCDSKDKVAKLKEKFGEDYLLQHPKQGHFTAEDLKAAEKRKKQKALLEQSI